MTMLPTGLLLNKQLKRDGNVLLLMENGAESHVGQIVKLIDQNQKFKLLNSKLMHLMEIQARFRNSFQNWIFPSLEPVKFLSNLIIFDNDFLENYQKVAY